MPEKPMFKVNDHIVYPAHGVGRVVGIETQTVAGYQLEVFVIAFEQDKMMLRVPTAKARSSGMRPLATTQVIEDALKTLGGRARIKRAMWSRRAQEYEAKINSGNIVQIAEVVRDLHRASDQPEQSYSERQLYESALDRLARELAAVENIEREEAMAKLSASLTKRAA
ncbi:MAG: CarD family transcriptional regulator [Caulobacterales bacterium]